MVAGPESGSQPKSDLRQKYQEERDKGVSDVNKALDLIIDKFLTDEIEEAFDVYESVREKQEPIIKAILFS